MRTKSTFSLTCVAILCCVLYACASTPGNLVGNKRFNIKTLERGGLIVGGVVSVLQPMSAAQRSQYARLLGQALQKHYRSTTVIGTDAVKEALGGPLYVQMLDSYRFHAAASTAFMNIIRQKIPNARYLVYARIENDQAQLDYTQYPADKGKSPYVDLSTKRLISISMIIYDLEDRRTLVWGGGLQDVGESQKRIFGRYQQDELKPLFPKPPAESMLVGKIFSGLAKNIVSKK